MLINTLSKPPCLRSHIVRDYRVAHRRQRSSQCQIRRRGLGVAVSLRKRLLDIHQWSRQGTESASDNVVRVRRQHKAPISLVTNAGALLSHLSDSNRRPSAYKAGALPAELRWRGAGQFCQICRWQSQPANCDSYSSVSASGSARPSMAGKSFSAYS